MVTETAPTVDLDVAVRAAIATTVAHLTGPVLGNAFDVNFGFSGMARLAEQLRDTTTKAAFTRRFADPAALAFVLRRLHECLELQYTAPGATRPIYADFLDEAATVTGQATLTDAAALFRRSAGHWSALADRAAAVLDTSGRDGVPTEVELSEVERRELFGALADLVDAARALEEEAVVVIRAG